MKLSTAINKAKNHSAVVIIQGEAKHLKISKEEAKELVREYLTEDGELRRNYWHGNSHNWISNDLVYASYDTNDHALLIG